VLVYIGFMERKSDLLGGSFVIFGRAKILFWLGWLFNCWEQFVFITKLLQSTKSTKHYEITGSLAQKIPSHFGG